MRPHGLISTPGEDDRSNSPVEIRCAINPIIISKLDGCLGTENPSRFRGSFRAVVTTLIYGEPLHMALLSHAFQPEVRGNTYFSPCFSCYTKHENELESLGA
jgi:hypothetical protein